MINQEKILENFEFQKKEEGKKVLKQGGFNRIPSCSMIGNGNKNIITGMMIPLEKFCSYIWENTGYPEVLHH